MEINSNIIISEDELHHLGVDIEELKKNLTLPNPAYQNMMRFGKGRFYKKVDTHICYLKKVGNNYIVPRYYMGELGKYGNEGRAFSINFKFSLRDYQKKFWDEYSHCFDESTGILFEAPCGSGKTICAIYMAILRGRQSLVLVPTYYLAKQWKQRIEESTNANCFVLTSKDKEIPLDSDFTIVVMDLFTCRCLPRELIENIGTVILDEAHRVGAEIYLPILEEIPAKYRIALTATFRRSDGVHKILAYHFGVHLKMESRFPKPFVYAIKTGVDIKGVISKNRKYTNLLNFLDAIGYTYHETNSAIEFNSTKELRNKLEDYYKVGSITKTAYLEISSCLLKASEMSYSVVESYLDSHSGRRKSVIQLIRKCLDAGRNVLFLSKRKSTLKALYKYFEAYKPMLIISETNNFSDKDTAYLQNTCPLIFGVTQLAKEGLDIDRLDTLIIHLPMKDTEQAIGRVSRLCEGKKQPMVFYLLDNCPMTYSVYSKAKKFISINGEFKGERTLTTLPTM